MKRLHFYATFFRSISNSNEAALLYKREIKDLPLAEQKKRGNFKDNEHSWHFSPLRRKSWNTRLSVQQTNRMESLSHPQTPSIRSHSPNSWSIWSQSSSPRFSQHYGKIRHCTPSIGFRNFNFTSIDGVCSQTPKSTRELWAPPEASRGSRRDSAKY